MYIIIVLATYKTGALLRTGTEMDPMRDPIGSPKGYQKELGFNF
jgi:hypothetical protein